MANIEMHPYIFQEKIFATPKYSLLQQGDKKRLACFNKCKQINFFGGSFNQLALKLSYSLGLSITSMAFALKFQVKANKT